LSARKGAASPALLRLTSRELSWTPDLVQLVTAARDAGNEVLLFERPMPDAVGVAGLGRVLDIVAAPGGVVLEGREHELLDQEPGADRLAAAARLWRRLTDGLELDGDPGLTATGAIAVGGFAFRPGLDPQGPWSGFPAVLLRVPELSVTRVRGRTFVTAASPEAERLLELEAAAFRAPAARRLEVEPIRNPVAWTGAVSSATRRLRAGEADKVVLAREVMARGDGVISADQVARALRAAYPACFTYLMTGADGTAFAGASPELLVRRSGRLAASQPMAGSTARGGDEAEDERLARQLEASAKDRAEHELVARYVMEALRRFSNDVSARGPEIVRFTNIQHLATTVEARLPDPAPSALELAAFLHPTPAVGGWPLAPALRIIDELEAMERGWYAGGVGWIDGRGDGEFAVALRCGLLWEDGARLYAGNGMMPDSDPAAELAETELKLRALLGALTG
jgi:salicylate biosynthesis isochorismate synthase/menaquinone-specific isochorismate synthase